MTEIIDSKASQSSTRWLKRYYFTRFAVAALWVAAALTIARTSMPLAAIMLIAYPAWDALANLADAQRNGGLAANGSQALNLAVSTLAAIAVAVALGMSMNAVLAVFGVWAILSGGLQLATAIRRWTTFGAQWSMILSGVQSALAGVFFVLMASRTGEITIANVAPYAAFGAFYFLVSATWLAVGDLRRRHGAA